MSGVQKQESKADDVSLRFLHRRDVQEHRWFILRIVRFQQLFQLRLQVRNAGFKDSRVQGVQSTNPGIYHLRRACWERNDFSDVLNRKLKYIVAQCLNGLFARTLDPLNPGTLWVLST